MRFHHLFARAAFALALTGFATAQPVPRLTPGVLYPTAGGSAYIGTGDFNGDGLTDVVTAENGTQRIALMLRQPDRSYGPPQFIAFSTANSFSSADFNGDGKTDLAFTNGTSVGVLINAGNATFLPVTYIAPATSASYVAAADYNNDGKIDLLTAGAGGFAVLIGDGAGRFTPGATMATTFPAIYLLVGDFNLDGKLDFVSGNLSFLGNGDGTFAAPLTIQNVPYGSQLGDFDKDGKLDLVTLTFTQRQDGAGQIIGIARGDGAGNFVTYLQWVMVNQRIGSPVVGDFTGDGNLDVAFLQGSTSELVVLAGNGAMSLSSFAKLPMAPGQGGSSPAVFDADNNGSSDIVLLHVASLEIFSATHGNPPLAALFTTSPAAAIGGAANVQGAVSLGGPAPQGGITVTLASSDPGVTFPSGATVVIPAGASSAAFPIATTQVANLTPVTLTATANFVNVPTVLNVVTSYQLSGIATSAPSAYSTVAVTGTVTLSSPADSSATVSLTSSNSAVVSVPPTVTVPATGAAASFPLTLTSVAADTPVTITATIGGVSKVASFTVLKPADSVQVAKAQDVVSKAQLRVDATSTNTAATITVWNAGTKAFIGTLANNGGGKYGGTFLISPAVLSITLKSSLGGTVTAPVDQK